MQSNIKIRLFSDSDSVSELTRLLNQSYRPLADMGLKYVATWQDDSITQSRIENGECYLAIIDSSIVGTITFYDASSTCGHAWYDNPDVASFGQFAVHPDFQGLGIGSLLMDKVENRARETGAKEIACDTAAPAKHLIEMYQKRGYRIVGHADWDVTNYISVILSKTLD